MRKHKCKYCGETEESAMMIKDKEGRRCLTLCKRCHSKKVVRRGRRNKEKAGPGKVVTSDLIQLAKDLGLKNVKPKSIHKVDGLTAEVVFRNYQDTDALEFPVIHHIRDDKPVEECLYGEQS